MYFEQFIIHLRPQLEISSQSLQKLAWISLHTSYFHGWKSINIILKRPKICGQEPRAAQFRFGVATSPRKCMQLFWRGDQRTPSNSDPKVGCTGKGACYTSLLGTDETICGSYHWLVWNCLSQERSSWTSLIHGHVSSHWRGPKNLPSTSAGERGEAADAWEMPFFMLVEKKTCTNWREVRESYIVYL